MTKKLILHGYFSDFAPNGEWVADFKTPREAIRSLETYAPDIRRFIADKEVMVWAGDIDIDEDRIDWTIPGDELHIAPALDGDGGRVGKIIIGLALVATGIGAAFAAGGFTAAAFGTAAFGNTLGITAGQLVLAGASMALMGFAAPPVPSTGDFSRNEGESKPSILYGGALNTTEVGIAHPVVYGMGVRVGGAIIHADLETVNRKLDDE